MDNDLLQNELQWEKLMFDRGVDRYMQNIERTKQKVNKIGNRVPVKDESTTSYGVGLLRKFVDKVAEALAVATKNALTGRGRSAIAYTYLVNCDEREAAYIASKCVIDSISKREGLTSLAMRIASRLEDQMRFASFQKSHPKYYRAILDDMKRRRVADYMHKRKVLVHVSNKAADEAEKPRWINWPPEHKAHIGVALIDCFIRGTSDYGCDCAENGNNCYQPEHRIPGTGIVEKVLIRDGRGKAKNYILGTEKAAVWIKSNMAVAATLQPDFMPCMIPPKTWTTPTDGGFHMPELRRRKPLVKTSPEHLKRLRRLPMEKVYTSVNAAQRTPWQINDFVLQQAIEEWRAKKGVGMPGIEKIEPPPCPLEPIEQGNMSDKAFRAYKKAIKQSLSQVEKERYKSWSDVAREFYTKEHERVSKMLGLSRVLGVAQMLRQQEEFYFVYTLDYRGRMYACGAGLNPQGPDLSKGLLKFSRKVPLGEYGYWHMCIHAAGVYGEDSGSLEDRVRWVHDHKKEIMQTGLDPATTRDFWKHADKPYMFLAVCEDLSKVWLFNPESDNNCYQKEDYRCYGSTYESQLFGAQDGKCNGIQHFSAMLRDPFGSKAVNISADPGNHDIYQITADEVVKMLKDILENGDVSRYFNGEFWDRPDYVYTGLVKRWLEFVVTRKATKKSTMVVPYGGTQLSCLKAVNTYIMDMIEERTELDPTYEHPFGEPDQKLLTGISNAAKFLHFFVWKALDKVVVASRRAMKFLRGIARVLAKHNYGVEWTTPTGFLVHQKLMSTRDVEVKTILSGRIELQLKIETDKVSLLDMCQAMPPNFVHSMDGSHLATTVSACQEQGIHDFALVHDSYGVHFGCCEEFHPIVRQQFANLYSGNVLKDLRRELVELYPELASEFPSESEVHQGDFDVNEVLRAVFAFR